ncbi:MAG: energy transducer TonB [Bacteroidota bacterium]|nr:energy transducer TonB [Bacteroidota bacterium]
MKYLNVIIFTSIVAGCSPTMQNINSKLNTKFDDESLNLPLIAFTKESAVDTTIDYSITPQLGNKQKPDSTVMPILTECPAPHYPPRAFSSGIVGTVWISALVNPEGRVVKVQIKKTDNESLNFYCLRAAIQWHYNPPLFNGVPGYYWVQIPFRFRQIQQ